MILSKASGGNFGVKLKSFKMFAQSASDVNKIGRYT